MGGEQGFCPKEWVIMNVFDNCPCYRNTVIGACATADLVQDQQAARCGVVKNVGCFDHLHHKGGLSGVDLVLCAYAGKDSVNQSDPGKLSGHKRSYLCHQND